MKNNFKLFFFIMTIMSTLFLISSYSWITIWLWLEVNLISFISLLINNKNKLTIESSLIYFLIQTIASIMFLFSIFMIMFYNNMIYLMIFSMMIKISMVPFHYWLPLMIEGINWMKILILLTWQKINPLILLYYNYYLKIIYIFVILSILISTISSLNYSSLKKMMSFSSINQLSWIMLSLIYSNLLKLYLLIYFYLMYACLILFKTFNLNFLNQMFNLNLKNNYFKMFLFMNFLSLSGMPPFLGFFPKMMIIMKMNNNFILFFMILFSLFMLFIYLRIIYNMLLLNSLKINKVNKINNFNKMNKLMMISIFNNFLMIMFFMF